MHGASGRRSDPVGRARSECEQSIGEGMRSRALLQGRGGVTGERPGVYVHGTALEITWRDATRNLGELIFDVVDGAVRDSGIGMQSVDSVVLAAHDLVDGRSLSSMVTAPAAGAYLRDEIRFGDDSAGAFAAAVTRLEAGHARCSIVAGWGRSSEHDPDRVSQALFDPFWQRPLGMRELDVSALRAQAWRLRHPGSSGWDDVVAASDSRATRARANPRAVSHGGHVADVPPLMPAGSMPVLADVVVAVVLSTEPSPIRVAGLGLSSEPYLVGDRDLVAMPALRTAARLALAEAGASAEQLDVVELDGLTLLDEAISLEAVGRAAPGQGLARLSADDAVNASGGGAAGYCAPAMGLTRIVEAALRLGPGGSGAQRAMATGSSVVGGQTQTAVVLEAA